MSPDAQLTAALVDAATVGGRAPSIHNTQPWRWRISGTGLSLSAVRDRQLTVTDPAGRMLTVSCGAALHHVRIVLAAKGTGVEVTRIPDEAAPDLLAQLTAVGPAAVDPTVERLAQAIHIRHTDRRPVSSAAVPDEALADLVRTATAEGGHLHLLRDNDLLELAAAAAHAQQVEGMDEQWRAELDYWVRAAPEGFGVPDEAIPGSAPQTTVPGRDFGHEGSLVVGEGHDRTARYAILYTDEDSPSAWLRGGETLSAVWLDATSRGLAVLPLSAVVEVPGTRQMLRRLLSGVGEPLLVLRIGVPDPESDLPTATPRLPAEQFIEIVGS